MTDSAPPDDGARHGDSGAPRRRRLHHWLAAVPGVAMLVGIPFANRTEPYVLGLPFLLFWILAWVVSTSALMGVVYALDEAGRARSADTREEER